MHKSFTCLAVVISIISCDNASQKRPVSTIDSQTISTPLPDQVVTDTDNHNVGTKSDIALDSPNGKKANDTLHHH